MITADERAREQGRRFVIVKGPDAVQRVFAITRLEERLDSRRRIERRVARVPCAA